MSPLQLKRYHVLMIAAASAAFFYASPALAQAVLPPPADSSGLDFGPILVSLIGLAAMVITVGGGVLVRFGVSFLSSKTGLSNAMLENLFADRIMTAVNAGIDYAEAKLKAEVGDPNSQIRNVKVDNYFLKLAAEYAMSRYPDAIAYFKLDKATIEQITLRQLNSIIGTPEENKGAPEMINAAKANQ